MSDDEFGARLRRLRQMHGLTLRQTASFVGVDTSYLSRIETGQFRPPAAVTIVRIATALGADADELCLLAGKIPPDVAALLTQPGALAMIRAMIPTRVGEAEPG